MSNTLPRWAIFSGSVVSAIANPDAWLLRALGRHLAAEGQEATFFEERGNAAVRALLRQRGGSAFAEFHRRYPEIIYRSIDPRSGVDLVEWLSRTLATFDVVVVQRDTPADITAWLGRLTRPHLQTYLLDTGLETPLSDLALETREPGNFSGVIVGTAEQASRYARWVAPDRIHLLRSLPDPSAGSDADADTRFRPAANELAQLVVALVERERRGWHVAGHSNGREP